MGIRDACEWLALWVERALGAALIFAVILSTANVVGRYVVGRTILGADELAVYAMVCVTFIGASVVAWREQHLRMDVLVGLMPPAVRRLIRYLEVLIAISLSAFVTYQSGIYAWRMYELGQESDMAGVPMWTVHGSVAIGFALLLLFLAVRTVGGSTKRDAVGAVASLKETGGS